MFSFNPSEPAILHDQKPGQERKKPTTAKIPSRYLMDQSRGGSSGSTDGATGWAADETPHRAFCSLGTLYLRDD
jgi:hypothetical protein